MTDCVVHLFYATSAASKHIPSYLINGCKPLRCACSVRRRRLWRDWMESVLRCCLTCLKRSDCVIYLWHTVYNDTRPHQWHTCAVGLCHGLLLWTRGFCWFLYAVLFTWREMHADISVCVCVCVCVAPAAGPGGDWASQTGHPSWDELNYSGRNLTPFNFKCYCVGLAEYC